MQLFLNVKVSPKSETDSLRPQCSPHGRQLVPMDKGIMEVIFSSMDSKEETYEVKGGRRVT